MYDRMRIESEYASVNNAEFAPEISNEFVTIYMDEPTNNRGGLSKGEAIDMT